MKKLSKSNFTLEYKQLLRRLKAARLEAKITQEDAAGRMGRHQSFISKIESGERRVDIVELVRLMRMYNSPLDVMLSDVFDEPSKKRQVKIKKAKL